VIFSDLRQFLTGWLHIAGISWPLPLESLSSLISWHCCLWSTLD